MSSQDSATMTHEEFCATLLNAFRMAVVANQDGIADELGDLVLAEMCNTGGWCGTVKPAPAITLNGSSHCKAE